jgi:hypothetical protein
VGFDAFISYSHAADGRLAPQLQSGLQRFAKPWWRRRALRVFRDESVLSANPHLLSSIEAALAESAWFVFLASPDAARSEWVGREIGWWLEHRDPGRILPVVTDGDFVWDSDGDRLDMAASTAAPAVLAEAFVSEPRWVDLRWARDRDDLELRDTRFRDAVADIAAPLHGVAKDDLESEEVRQHRRTVRTAIAAGAMLAVLAVVAAVAGVFAVVQRDEARDQRAEAEYQAEVASATAESERSQRLVAQARQVAEAQLDVGLLLAVEASLRDPGPRTDQALLEVLAGAGSIMSVRPVSGSADALQLQSEAARRRIWLVQDGDTTRLVPLDLSRGTLGAPLQLRDSAWRLVPLGGGERLAVAYADGTLEVLESANGEVLATRSLGRPPSQVLGADGGELVVVVPTSPAAVGAEETGVLQVVFLSATDLTTVAVVDVPGGYAGYSVSIDDAVLWSTVGGAVVPVTVAGAATPVVVDMYPTAMAVHEETGMVAVADFTNGAVVVARLGDDAQDARVVATYDDGHTATALRFSADGGRLYAGRDDGAIYRYDLTTDAERVPPVASTGGAMIGIRPVETGPELAALTGTRWFWIDPDRRSPLADLLRPARTGEYADAVAVQGDRAAVGLQPGKVEVRSLSDGTMAWVTVIGQNGVIPALAPTDDGGWVASMVEFPGIDLGLLRQQQLATGSSTRTALTADLVEPLQASSLVALGADGDIRWRLSVPQPIIGVVQIDDDFVAALDVDGTLYAVSSDDGTVVTRRDGVVPSSAEALAGGRPGLLVQDLSGSFRRVRWIDGAFVPDAELHAGFYVSAVDTTVTYIDRGFRQWIADADDIDSARLVGAESLCASGAWALENGTSLVRILCNGDVELRDAVTGGRIAHVPGVSDPDTHLGVVTLPDGGFLSLSVDGEMLRWTFDRDEHRRRACEIVDRDLTDEEWNTYLAGEPPRRTCGAVTG